MRIVTLPYGPAESLIRFAKATRPWLGPDQYRLGGGTALAARWQHRDSTDIDLFTQAQVLRQVLRRNLGGVRRSLRALTERPGEKAEVGIDYIEVRLEGAPVSLLTLEPKLGDDASDERAQGTQVALETTGEIIARKIHERVLREGQYSPRDFYDFVYARRKDPNAWSRSTGTIGERQWSTIIFALERMAPDWGREEKTGVSGAADERLLGNLKAEAIGLAKEGKSKARERRITGDERSWW